MNDRLLGDWGHEKREKAKQRAQVDCDQLIAQGKMLSREQQHKLSKALKEYFTHERVNPTSELTADQAWLYQGNLLLHLLNDDVLAVPRSEVLGPSNVARHAYGRENSNI